MIFLTSIILYPTVYAKVHQKPLDVFYSTEAKDSEEAWIRAVTRMLNDYPECEDYAVISIKEF